MTYQLLDTVVLARDLPEHGLQRGDLGAVVLVHTPELFEVEFVAASGRTQALLPVAAEDLRPIAEDDLIAVRTIQRVAG